MAVKAAIAHQPVISIRISEVLRSRLESLKEVIAHKTGKSVSTSEAAKQLLESARDDRLELANLLTEPTDSLLNIRGKAEAHLPLTQAEWTLVAHYCAKGAESFASSEQGQLSYESLADILEAFLAAYAIALRRKKVSLDFFYLMTLPEDKQVATKDPNAVDSEDLRRVVNRTIQMLRDPVQKRRRPLLAVRNLYTLLDGGRRHRRRADHHHVRPRRLRHETGHPADEHAGPEQPPRRHVDHDQRPVGRCERHWRPRHSWQRPPS
jgi:hypothetical protein